MKHQSRTWLRIGGIVGILLLAAMVFAGELSVWERPDNMKAPEISTQLVTPVETAGMTGERGAYLGNFRVYVVEPEARWKDDDNQIYHYGFLGFAVNEEIILTDQTVTGSVIWDADDYTPAYGLNPNNIEVIGVVFNGTGHSAYSDPPSGYPFTAYYSDACAAATPGHAGSNSTAGGYTHTVFLEEGTAPWCSSCPGANYSLSYVKANMGLNFHYAAIVIDGEYGGPASPADAYMRIGEYNLHWLPTVYSDGGMDVLSDGAFYTVPYVNMINAAGARAVADLDLDVSMTFLGGNAIQVDYSITLNGWTNSAPEVDEAPQGNTAQCAMGNTYEFHGDAFDSDYQDMYIRWDYGNGFISDWYGPYENDEDCLVNYSWGTRGEYAVKIQAKDAMDVESPWSAALDVEAYLCGDVNDEGSVNVLDIVTLVNYKFKGGDAPRILASADVDHNGAINVLDIVAMVNFKFKSGPELACP